MTSTIEKGKNAHRSRVGLKIANSSLSSGPRGQTPPQPNYLEPRGNYKTPAFEHISHTKGLDKDATRRVLRTLVYPKAGRALNRVARHSTNLRLNITITITTTQTHNIIRGYLGRWATRVTAVAHHVAPPVAYHTPL